MILFEFCPRTFATELFKKKSLQDQRLWIWIVGALCNCRMLIESRHETWKGTLMTSGSSCMAAGQSDAHQYSIYDSHEQNGTNPQKKKDTSLKFLLSVFHNKPTRQGKVPNLKECSHAELVTHSGGTLLTSYKMFLAKRSSENCKSQPGACGIKISV